MDKKLQEKEKELVDLEGNLNRMWDKIIDFLLLELLGPELSAIVFPKELNVAYAISILHNAESGEQLLENIKLSDFDKRFFLVKPLGLSHVKQHIRAIPIGKAEFILHCLDTMRSLFWLKLESEYEDALLNQVGIRSGFKVFKIPAETS